MNLPICRNATQSQALALGATIMLPGQVLQTTERPEQNRVETDPAPEAVEILNDVEAAIEVNLGKGFQPLYPGRSLTCMCSESTVLEVRLRDDHGTYGRRSHPDMLLRVADAFGGFGENVSHFLERQKCLVQRERESQKTRHSKLEKAVWHKYKGAMCEYNSVWALSFLLMIAMLVIPFDNNFFEGSWRERERELISESFYFTMLSIAALAFWGTSSLFVILSLLRIATFRKVRDKLLGGRGEPTKGMKGDPSKWQNRLSAFQLFLNTSSILALAIQFGEMNFFLGVYILLLPLLCFSCIAIPTLRGCGPVDRFVSTSERIYLGQVCQGTIVFEGSVLPASPCICSWPGKYESAWETLVKCSREGTLSAAVVFLPGGSEHFGTHDPIPVTEGLEGSCWCVPLYGERKPWGCRWWSRWIQNVEKAVEEDAKLQVYYFSHKKGKGKAQSFTTVGAENLRREAIHQRQEDFKRSAEFEKAKHEGLDSLCKDTEGDSSSQYTREVQRLFLEWLPDEDREFLEASEGLGNSQKAEVAWLERKGYSYTEADRFVVNVLELICSNAIIL